MNKCINVRSNYISYSSTLHAAFVKKTNQPSIAFLFLESPLIFRHGVGSRYLSEVWIAEMIEDADRIRTEYHRDMWETG